MKRVVDLEWYDDPRAFESDAQGFLASNALRATVISSMLVRLLAGEQVVAKTAPTPYWFAVQRDASGAPDGLAMRSGDWPPYLLDVRPDAARRLAGEVLARGERPGGANGTLASAQAFCERLIEEIGGAVHVERATRLFQVTHLVPPTGVPGEGRLARADEVDFCTDWFLAFHDEVGEAPTASREEQCAEYRAIVADRTAQDCLWLWEDDGRVVSLAGARPAAFGFARIGPVYTPPENRGHGFAAAVTCLAALTIQGRDATPCLFTDLANPTSNGVYQRIGFEPVEDTVNLRIGAP